MKHAPGLIAGMFMSKALNQCDFVVSEMWVFSQQRELMESEGLLECSDERRLQMAVCGDKYFAASTLSGLLTCFYFGNETEVYECPLWCNAQGLAVAHDSESKLEVLFSTPGAGVFSIPARLSPSRVEFEDRITPVYMPCTYCNVKVAASGQVVAVAYGKDVYLKMQGARELVHYFETPSDIIDISVTRSASDQCCITVTTTSSVYQIQPNLPIVCFDHDAHCTLISARSCFIQGELVTVSVVRTRTGKSSVFVCDNGTQKTLGLPNTACDSAIGLNFSPKGDKLYVLLCGGHILYFDLNKIDVNRKDWEGEVKALLFCSLDTEQNGRVTSIAVGLTCVAVCTHTHDVILIRR